MRSFNSQEVLLECLFLFCFCFVLFCIWCLVFICVCEKRRKGERKKKKKETQEKNKQDALPPTYVLFAISFDVPNHSEEEIFLFFTNHH